MGRTQFYDRSSVEIVLLQVMSGQVANARARCPLSAQFDDSALCSRRALSALRASNGRLIPLFTFPISLFLGQALTVNGLVHGKHEEKKYHADSSHPDDAHWIGIQPTTQSVPRSSSHPQTEPSACRSASDPVIGGVKLRDGRHRGYAISTQLRELLSLGSIYVHEPIHVPYAKPLHSVPGLGLPLCSKAVSISADGARGKS
jgi:hypothetical protein